jgi:hypothetical protein
VEFEEEREYKEHDTNADCSKDDQRILIVESFNAILLDAA